MEAVVSAPEMIFFIFASLRIATVRTAALSYLSARFSIWNDSACREAAAAANYRFTNGQTEVQRQTSYFFPFAEPEIGYLKNRHPLVKARFLLFVL